jgi:hypothetical protein
MSPWEPEISHGIHLSVLFLFRFVTLWWTEYSKACGWWVPQSLTEEHKEQRKIICSELLSHYGADGDDFLSTIVMGNETWIHHLELERKGDRMECHHTTSPQKKKCKTIPSASKIMATVFSYCEGMILIDVLPRGQTINSDVYVETLKKFSRRVRPNKDVTKVLLHHDNTRPHTSLHTRETIKILQWTVLPHPSYNPDLAPSDDQVFQSF